MTIFSQAYFVPWKKLSPLSAGKSKSEPSVRSILFSSPAASVSTPSSGQDFRVNPAQFGLLDLAHRVAGQGIDHNDAARLLESRKRA